MKEITEFMTEEGFELNGYISQLFKRVSDEKIRKPIQGEKDRLKYFNS